MIEGAVAIVVGFALGLLFFGGLWWTVRHMADSRRPALLLVGSLLLRIAIVLAGFFWVADGEWSRWLLCVLGFLAARRLVTWSTRPPPLLPPCKEPQRAP